MVVLTYGCASPTTSHTSVVLPFHVQVLRKVRRPSVSGLPWDEPGALQVCDVQGVRTAGQSGERRLRSLFSEIQKTKEVVAEEEEEKEEAGGRRTEQLDSYADPRCYRLLPVLMEVRPEWRSRRRGSRRATRWVYMWDFRPLDDDDDDDNDTCPCHDVRCRCSWCM